MMKAAAVFGGDIRQYYLASELAKNGYVVHAYNLNNRVDSIDSGKIREALSVGEAMSVSDMIILPIPVSEDGKTIKGKAGDDTILLSEVIDNLRVNHIVFGGMIPDSLRDACDKCIVPCFDFMSINSVAVKNAIATAEGAVAEAIMLGDGVLHRSNTLIIGFGRCARVLASKLTGLSACVTVMTRREEARAEAWALGYEVLPMFRDIRKQDVCGKCDGYFQKYDYVFNTVPATVLPEQILKRFSPQVVIIDIASKPGGTDFSYCEKMGIRARLCLGLPGRYAPAAAGMILAQAVLGIQGNRENDF